MSTPDQKAMSAGLSYRDAGVLDNAELGLSALVAWTEKTREFRADAVGRPLLSTGYFANVIGLGGGLCLALTTDGVGSKILVAELLDRYDTIGIDCVAMNVNDVICVGAEPVSMLDYIAIERSTPEMLGAIGKGLHEGARLAGISIVGGEISQMPEMIRGIEPEKGADLVGMCVGIVKEEAIHQGQDVAPGDVILGLRSSGVHCNGLTLARKALLHGRFEADAHVPELGRSVGQELLEPTRIYVREVMEMLRQELPVKALVNVTSDGFLNLTRVQARVGFRIDRLPEPQPIFSLIQEAGGVSDAEMFRVFNMGIGFCVVVPDDAAVLDAAEKAVRRHGGECHVIGRVIDAPGEVHLPAQELVGKNGEFLPRG